MLVVFRHFFIFHGCDQISSVAVPIFFMISGFLLWNADPEKFQQRLLKNLKNIAKITLWSSLLYIAIDLIKHDTESLNFESLTNFLIFNRPPFFGFHLWYLFAYIYVLVFFYILTRSGLNHYIKYFVPILLIGQLLLGKYSFIYGQNFGSYISLNFFFNGLPFFSIGLLIKQNLEMIRPHLKLVLFLFLIFLVLLATESTFLKMIQSSGGVYIFTIFCAISVFLIFILYRPLKENWLSWIGKELSLYIYIFHLAIGRDIIPVLYVKLGLDVVIPHLIRAISYLLISILASWIFVKTKGFFYSRLKARKPAE